MSHLHPAPPHPLVDDALRRVRRCVRAAAERSIESLGLSALASTRAHQREALQAAQFELERKVGPFGLAFDEALVAPAGRADPTAASSGADDPHAQMAWERLSLVGDDEVEIEVQADRFALEVGHACEWELRELDAYMATLVGATAPERNPLRPERVGRALMKALASVSDRPEVRKAVETELTRSLTTMLRDTYAAIVSNLRQAGVKPASLSVRVAEARTDGGLPRDAASAAGPASSAAPGGGAGAFGGGAGPFGGGSAARRPGFSNTGTQPLAPGDSRYGSFGGSASFGQVDPGLMALIRRLAVSEPSPALGSGEAGFAVSAPGGLAAALPNLIHANRDALRQASRGGIDHLVIDVIASLFDQILSDPKVPPQLARQIARLQLPVLRAALGDPGFFSSRRHPVRQFVNRIASLAHGFDDFDDAQAQAFVARVRDLVQEIVEGDFDRVATYETRLASLEASVAEQSRAAVEARHAGATALLQHREDALRLTRHYAERLDLELLPLAGPAFVRDFVARVWSRVILTAAEREGVTSDAVRELRRVGRELFMSVQPKATPAQRKVFLAELPRLMKSINDGLNSIGWPDERRRAFFGQLMPAHAEALKVQAGSVLDFNLLARQVEQVFDRGVPTVAELGAADRASPIDVPDAADFTRDEAARIGLVEESAVDWNGKVDIDLGAEPEVQAADLALPGLPAPAEPPEPRAGASLADHVQIGFSYQMHLKGSWEKVRLAHVSPGRTFFVFTQGSRHQRTISFTHRMLVRLCETGRLRAFEGAQLIERATARARRQLSTLPAPQPR